MLECRRQFNGINGMNCISSRNRYLSSLGSITITMNERTWTSNPALLNLAIVLFSSMHAILVLVVCSPRILGRTCLSHPSLALAANNSNITSQSLPAYCLRTRLDYHTYFVRSLSQFCCDVNFEYGTQCMPVIHERNSEHDTLYFHCCFE